MGCRLWVVVRTSRHPPPDTPQPTTYHLPPSSHGVTDAHDPRPRCNAGSGSSPQCPGLRPDVPRTGRLGHQHRLRLCRRPLGRPEDRRHGVAGHDAPRRGELPALLARREQDRLHRQLRRQPGRVRDPGPGRRAGARDAPPDARPAGGLVSRRALAPRRDLDGERPPALRPVLQGPGDRRPAGEAPGALRRVRRDLARRPHARLPADEPGLPDLEALPRRVEGRHLAVRPADLRVGERHARFDERCAADVARPHAVLHLRPGFVGAQQRLGVRPRHEAVPRGHALHRLRHHLPGRRPRRHRLPERGPALPARSRDGADPRGAGQRRDGPRDAEAARFERRLVHRERADLVHRPARPDRGAGRRLLAPGRARARPEPHAVHGRRRAVPRLVPRREASRVLERPVGRVRAVRAARRRLRRGTQAHDLRPRLPLPAVLVARQQEDRVHRPVHADLDLQFRVGRDDARGQGVVDVRRGARGLPAGVVGRQPVAGLRTRPRRSGQYGHLPVRHALRRGAPGHVGLLQRQLARLRPGREVPLLPDQPRLPADLQRRGQHLGVRQHHERRGGRTPRRRALAAGAPRRRGGGEGREHRRRAAPCATAQRASAGPRSAPPTGGRSGRDACRPRTRPRRVGHNVQGAHAGRDRHRRLRAAAGGAAARRGQLRRPAGGPGQGALPPPAPGRVGRPQDADRLLRPERPRGEDGVRRLAGRLRGLRGREEAPGRGGPAAARDRGPQARSEAGAPAAHRGDDRDGGSARGVAADSSTTPGGSTATTSTTRTCTACRGIRCASAMAA